MKSRILIVDSAAAPRAIVDAAADALAADADVRRVDVGKIGQTGGVAQRALEFLLGESEARRLGRELTAFAPDVAIAFEPGAAAALADARDAVGTSHAAVVVAVVPELQPGRAWAVDADRLVAVDDEAAVALVELGLDGARIAVVGALVDAARVTAARDPKSTARAKLADPGVVVLVDGLTLGAELTEKVVPQLALLEGVVALFDAGDDASLAAILRRKVPGLGLKAKLFGATPSAPGLWRAADLVITRAKPTAIARTIAAGAALIAIEPYGAEDTESKALAERGLGTSARTAALLAGVLQPLIREDGLRKAAAREGDARGAGGAAQLTALVLGVARERESVLAETFGALEERRARSARRTAEAAARKGAATDVEDLGGDLDAAIAADLGLDPPVAAPPPRRNVDAVLDQMKRKQVRSVDDELAALKKRMETEKKR